MPDPKEPFNFATWLEEFAHGTTNKIASDRLTAVVQACEETGRKGSITIKIDVSTTRGLAEIRANVTVKKPEPAMPGQNFYVRADGALVDEDPKQLTLPAPKVIPVREVIHVHHTPQPATDEKG